MKGSMTWLLMISVFTVVSLNINSQSLPRFQIIDSKYKTPIPFAYVKVPNKNILEVTDLDGYFNRLHVYRILRIVTHNTLYITIYFM